MRDYSIVQIDGSPMPLDLNIEHHIGYAKELCTFKGVYSTWDRFCNVAATTGHLMTLKTQVRRSMATSYQKRSHTDPESLEKLVWKVADVVQKNQLQLYIKNRPGNDDCTQVSDLLSLGHTKLASSALGNFNTSMDLRIKGMVEEVASQEEDEIPENQISISAD